MKKLKFFWVAALASLVLSASAQTKDKPWAIGANVVRSVYIGDLGDTFFDFDKQLNIGGGLTIDRYLSRFFDIGLYGSISKLGYNTKYSEADQAYYNVYDGWNTLTGGGYYNFADRGKTPKNGNDNNNVTQFSTSALITANAHLRFKFLGNDDTKFVPFALLSAGLVGYHNPSTHISVNNGSSYIDNKYLHVNDLSTNNFKRYHTPIAWTVGTGLGAEWRFIPALALRYQAEIMWTDHDNRDFVVNGGTDWQFQHTLGLVWSFGGKSKDSDGDGVKDSRDLCPNTPAGVKVDVNGCPIDSDGDGVADYLDKCPDTPAGVAVDTNGCPIDSDGDGVPDYLDKCPNTPHGAKVDANGCPIDSDGDGVPDYLDKCPDTPANVKVDASGCPIDTDGDGIPDYLDKCPREKGPKWNDGCPAPTSKFETATVYFATNLYNLTNESTATLDKAVASLKANPEYSVKIEGHTDSTGTLAFNRALANSRANTVKQYLIKKGIDKKRIVSTEGFWYSKPAADNDTEAGRAKNRRAEVIGIVVQ